MTTPLQPNTVLKAESVRLEELPIDSGTVIWGEPRTSISELATIDSVTVGVWEITPGVVTDREVDEVFVVISGSAVVEFENTECLLHLTAGTIGRLRAGTRSRWTVTETLRKVYITLPEAKDAAHVTTASKVTDR
ncbi:cupin domain-containing protein [Subtercola lobariae]|uniref:Cupin n=1 Tax=Subtercola lobariae TaxID=1588641 RepID=A0A917B4F9_9MICO|nr:cupin domain-containing protein [Subtercola lobariae]GGF19322.1 cupin [Subtercola lobariae]